MSAQALLGSNAAAAAAAASVWRFASLCLDDTLAHAPGSPASEVVGSQDGLREVLAADVGQWEFKGLQA